MKREGSTVVWMCGRAPAFVRRALGRRDAAALDDGQWHHVVVVKQRRRPMKVYVDGKRVARRWIGRR